MTGQLRADGRSATFASSLHADAPPELGSIRSAALRCFALVAFSMLLILVILPAVLGAAGIQAVAAV